MKTINKTRLIEDHFVQQGYEFCKLRGKVTETDRIISHQTGDHHPFFNGVMHSYMTEQQLLSAIDKYKQEALEKGLPLSWIVGPSSQPSPIKEILLEKGFINPFFLTGMFAQMDKVDFSSLENPDIQIRRVDSSKMLEEWREVLAIGIEDQLPADFLEELFNKLGFDHDCTWQNYLGYCDGKAVCCSSMFLYKESAGIYCVATLPEFRKKGFGQAVTLAPLKDAADRGIRHSVLHASEMAITMYQKLGYDEQCRLEGFLFNL